MNMKFTAFIIISVIIEYMNGYEVEETPNSECDQRSEVINGKSYTYCCINCHKIYEGDMVLSGSCCDDNRRRLNPLRTPRNNYWPNGYIPYEIDPSLPNQARVTDAVNYWNTHTNIRLAPRSGETDYVLFQPSTGCSSAVGKIGGRQTINLASGCSTGNNIHEIGHALGMYHTQSREDRNDYVTINFGNIIPGRQHNFNQVNDVADDCLRYDYGSIMHYPRTAFSSNGQDTIVPKQSGVSIGQRDDLSVVDIGCIDSKYSPCRVALFEHGDFSGREYSPFGSNDYTHGELIDLEFVNDDVSSMKIEADKDTKCIVELFEHGDYTGWRAEIVADNSQSESINTFTYTLGQLQGYGVVNDQVSAMKVNHVSSCTVTLYQHDFYVGNRYGPYSIGDYTFNHLQVRGFTNDDVTSLRIDVLSGEVCIIELFQHGDYSGWKATITTSSSQQYPLTSLLSLGFVNDDMSSMKISAQPESSSAKKIYYDDFMDQLDPGMNDGMYQVHDVNNNNSKRIITLDNPVLIYIIMLLAVLLLIGLSCYNYNKKYEKYSAIQYQTDSSEV